MSSNSGKNRAATFLDPLDIFGVRKGLNAQAYGDSMSQINASQTALANRMFSERDQYSSQAQTLLGQAPRYNVPAYVANYNALMQRLGNSAYTTANDYATQLANTDYTSAGAADLRQGYQQASDIYNQGAASLRSIMRSGVDQSQQMADTALRTGLSDTAKFSDYYRQLASRTEMPGQRTAQAQIGRSYAEAYKALSQQGAGASGLGAMIDAYNGKADALAGLEMQSAQYRINNEQNLAGALERAASVRNQLYNQSAAGYLDRASALAQTEQAATGMQGGIATQQADALSNYALQQQNLAQSSIAQQNAMIQQGIASQGEMQGQGLLTQAQYADQAYQYNQLLPWQTGMNFYMAQIQGLNPYAAMSDAYNNQMTGMMNMYNMFGKNAIYGTGQVSI